MGALPPGVHPFSLAEGPRLRLHQWETHPIPSFLFSCEGKSVTCLKAPLKTLPLRWVGGGLLLGPAGTRLPKAIAVLAVASLQQICLSWGKMTFVAEQTAHLLFKRALSGSMFLFIL